MYPQGSNHWQIPPALRLALFVSLFTCLRGDESVAIVVAGQFRGSHRTALELQRVLVRPLVHSGIRVHLFAGGYSTNESAWREWGQAAVGNHSNFTFLNIPEPTEELLAVSFWRFCNGGYHPQYGALHRTWAQVIDRQAYTYAIRMRSDLLFPEVQAFKPCWLRELPENIVLTTDIEIHQSDRWNQRGIESKSSMQGLDYFAPFSTYGLNVSSQRRMSAQPRFPTMTCDQFFAGHVRDVDLILSLNGAEPWTAPCPGNGHIENILAIYLFSVGVDVYTITLSPRRNNPAEKAIGPVDWAPAPRPCFLCYDCFNHSQ